MTLASRVSSSSRLRIDPNSRATSASVSSVLVYSPLVLEQPRVLDRDCDVRAELPQHRFVDERELARRVAQQIERADHASLPTQRHDELRVRPGHRFDVPRIVVNVVDEQRKPAATAAPTRPSPNLHPQRARHLGRIADRVRHGELFALRIKQVDGERLKLA